MVKRKGLPSSIVKQYGMTKKAWRIFKSRQKSPKKRTTTKKKRRVRTMPRRKKKSYRRKGKSGVTLTKALMGGFGVVIADQVADQLLAKFNLGVSDDIIKFGVGVYFSRKGGMIGEASKALAYVNAAKLLSNINIGGIFGSTTNGTTNGGW